MWQAVMAAPEWTLARLPARLPADRVAQAGMRAQRTQRAKPAPAATRTTAPTRRRSRETSARGERSKSSSFRKNLGVTSLSQKGKPES